MNQNQIEPYCHIEANIKRINHSCYNRILIINYNKILFILHHLIYIYKSVKDIDNLYEEKVQSRETLKTITNDYINNI